VTVVDEVVRLVIFYRHNGSLLLNSVGDATSDLVLRDSLPSTIAGEWKSLFQ
jgi:hypothetical protein